MRRDTSGKAWSFTFRSQGLSARGWFGEQGEGWEVGSTLTLEDVEKVTACSEAYLHWYDLM